MVLWDTETAIGFFPDVGGSYFLSRLKGGMGMYLALTGARLKGRDAVEAGVATHYVPRSRLIDLKHSLVNVSTGTTEEVENVISSFVEPYDPATVEINQKKDAIRRFEPPPRLFHVLTV